MVKEIKFKGKSLEDNKWIYGSFIDNTQCDFDSYISCDNGNLIKVDRETISQYTGLKDKNDVEIYEFSEIDNSYYITFDQGSYILRHISNDDIIDLKLYDYWSDKNGKIEVTKEYSKF